MPIPEKDKYSEEQVKHLFSKHGTVTDCRLVKDKSGKSRRIAYVGYKSISEANIALKVRLYFSQSLSGVSLACVQYKNSVLKA